MASLWAARKCKSASTQAIHRLRSLDTTSPPLHSAPARIAEPRVPWRKSDCHAGRGSLGWVRSQGGPWERVLRIFWRENGGKEALVVRVALEHSPQAAAMPGNRAVDCGGTGL